MTFFYLKRDEKPLSSNLQTALAAIAKAFPKTYSILYIQKLRKKGFKAAHIKAMTSPNILKM